MDVRIPLITIAVLAATTRVLAQQLGDPSFKPAVPAPAYRTGEGPRVVIDEAHNNFHTVNGRYKPFAELLRLDGYRVGGLAAPISAASLKGVGILVIANPLHERNVRDWSLPTPSAFTEKEIAALRAWVEGGGSLLLIADHMPFPGAAGALAKAFGFEFSNGFAFSGRRRSGMPDRFGPGIGLRESVLTRGRNDREKVTEVATFTGSAFKPPKGAISVLVFGPKSVSLEPKKAWKFNPETPKTPIDGWCQVAIMEVGRGRVAVSGEAAMFTAQLSGARKAQIGMNSPHAKQNYRFLLNLMHWLSRAPGMKVGQAPRKHSMPGLTIPARRRHGEKLDFTRSICDSGWNRCG